MFRIQVLKYYIKNATQLYYITLLFFQCLDSTGWMTDVHLAHNNNNQIYIAPYGRNFRGTGSRSDQCSVKA